MKPMFKASWVAKNLRLDMRSRGKIKVTLRSRHIAILIDKYFAHPSAEKLHLLEYGNKYRDPQ